MHFEQRDCRLPDADSVFSDALVTTIIILPDFLNGQVTAIYYTDPVTRKSQGNFLV
jgi:hypothetical protein